MKINNDGIVYNTTQGISNIDKTNTNQNIGELMVQNSGSTQTQNNIIGKNAEVNLEKTPHKSTLPGFTEQKIHIKTASGIEFDVSLHTQASIDREKANQFKEKICRVISNFPPKVLEDMKAEMKHITLCPNIILNKDALALGVCEINQIFLSTDKMADLSEKEIEETLIHEQGHLADRLEGTFAGKGSKYMKKSFDALKEVCTPEFGFEENSYTLSNTSEFFADYYLYKNGEPSNKHRGKQFFDLLENYSNDVNKLTEIELLEKYGEKTLAIKDIVTKWSAIKKELDFYLKNVQSGDYPRANEKAKPHTIEQMVEINERINNKKVAP